MSAFDDLEKQALLALARSVIATRLVVGAQIKRPDPVTPAMASKQGCFVTLHKKGALRGCIGTLEPITSLVDGVEENALNAAFRDPRFPPLREKELPEVDIEISVLTPPRPLAFKTPEDLIRLLKPRVHGVILSKGGRRATFLPQVWEQLPETASFLEHLCMKAGLGKNCWKDPDLSVLVYEVEYFSE